LKKREEPENQFKKKEQRNKQLKSTAYVVFLFDFAGHRCRREEKEKKPVSACCFPGGRAASDGGALEQAPPAVPASNSCAEGFPCNFWSFEDCFVNLDYLM
jgi:hypothetical protein